MPLHFCPRELAFTLCLFAYTAKIDARYARIFVFFSFHSNNALTTRSRAQRENCKSPAGLPYLLLTFNGDSARAKRLPIKTFARIERRSTRKRDQKGMWCALRFKGFKARIYRAFIVVTRYRFHEDRSSVLALTKVWKHIDESDVCSLVCPKSLLHVANRNSAARRSVFIKRSMHN